MSHLCFVTPLFFAVLFSALRTNVVRKGNFFIVFSIMLFFLVLVVFQKIKTHDSLWGNSVNGQWVPDFGIPDFQRETHLVVEYVAKNSKKEEKVITLGCYPSINIWTDRDSPGALVHAAYNYFSEPKQQGVIEELRITKYAILHLQAERYQKELDLEGEGAYRNLVAEMVFKDFEEVPSEEWNGSRKAEYLKILVNKNIKKQIIPK